jgi:predicted peptidase
MRNLTKTLITAALMIVPATPCIQAADGTTSSADKVQMAKKFTFEKNQRYELSYLLFMPKDYSASGGKKWPMILFLHGAGERGNDVWKVAKHGPPKNVVQRRAAGVVG